MEGRWDGSRTLIPSEGGRPTTTLCPKGVTTRNRTGPSRRADSDLVVSVSIPPQYHVGFVPRGLRRGWTRFKGC